MTADLLGAGTWTKERARKIAMVDPRKRTVMTLVDALRGHRSCTEGSVASALAGPMEAPEVSPERPDGYVFADDPGPHPVVTVSADGKTVGDVCIYGHSEALEQHPDALAHARWRLAKLRE